MHKQIITASFVATSALIFLGAGCSTATTPTPTLTVVAFDTTATNAEILAEANGQWAVSATASSAYGTDSWAAKQATGKPNVKEFGDNGKAWAPLEKTAGAETLELTFAEAVNATGVRVRENYGNGAITQIDLRAVDGTYYPVWSGTDTTTGLKDLQVAIEKTAYAVAGVKLTFDTSGVGNEWAEIDAVQLVGE